MTLLSAQQFNCDYLHKWLLFIVVKICVGPPTLFAWADNRRMVALLRLKRPICPTIYPLFQRGRERFMLFPRAQRALSRIWNCQVYFFMAITVMAHLFFLISNSLNKHVGVYKVSLYIYFFFLLKDFVEAFESLLELKLKPLQEREIIHVIIDCCVQEEEYNPYYAYLLQKFCELHRRFQVMFNSLSTD